MTKNNTINIGGTNFTLFNHCFSILPYLAGLMGALLQNIKFIPLAILASCQTMKTNLFTNLFTNFFYLEKTKLQILWFLFNKLLNLNHFFGFILQIPRYALRLAPVKAALSLQNMPYIYSGLDNNLAKSIHGMGFQPAKGQNVHHSAISWLLIPTWRYLFTCKWLRQAKPVNLMQNQPIRGGV